MSEKLIQIMARTEMVLDVLLFMWDETEQSLGSTLNSLLCSQCVLALVAVKAAPDDGPHHFLINLCVNNPNTAMDV